MAQLDENINALQLNIEQIKRKQLTIITSPLYVEDERKGYDALIAQTNELARTVRQQLQTNGSISIIGSNDEQNEQNATNQLLLVDRKMENTFLAQKFITIMTEYNQIQIDFQHENKRKLQRYTTEVLTNDTGIEAMLEQDGLHGYDVFSRKLLISECDPLEAKQVLAEIEARHNDILKLEASILELHEMKMSMARIVESAAEVVERAEYHIEVAEEYILRGNENVTSAVKDRKMQKKKKKILRRIGAGVGGTVVCVAVIILIIL